MKPTGSSLGRAYRCPASHALPRVEETGNAAETGNVIHDYLEKVCTDISKRDEALDAVPEEHRKRCAHIDINKLVGTISNRRCEIAIALGLEPLRARVIGLNVKRKYGDLADDEIACTLDIEGQDNVDGTYVCLDFKTGQNIGDVELSWQIRTQALALKALHGVDEVIGRVAYIDEFGNSTIEEYRFDVFDLDLTRTDLVDILRRVREAEKLVAEGGMPTTYPSDQCKYCPSISFCPAKTALVRSMVTDIGELASKIESLSAEQTGLAWTKLTQFKQLAEKVEEAIKARVQKDGFVPLPDGKVLKPVPMSRPHTNAKRALALLKEYGASDEEIESCMSETKFNSYRSVKEKLNE